MLQSVSQKWEYLCHLGRDDETREKKPAFALPSRVCREDGQTALLELGVTLAQANTLNRRSYATQKAPWLSSSAPLGSLGVKKIKISWKEKTHL